MEKVKGIYGSKTRADEVLEWLKSQGADDRSIEEITGDVDFLIYYVNKQGQVLSVTKVHEELFDIVELPRWRAISAGLYFYVSDRGCVIPAFDTGSAGQERFECGNYFKTKEEAEIYAEKFRKLFNERREK